MRRGSGFTLLEVLLAVVIFAIVLSAMHVVFYGALRLRNKTVAMFEEALPLQQTLAILKRDLVNLVPPGGTFFGQLQSVPSATNQLGQVASMTATSVGGNAPGQTSPTFYTATGIISDHAPWGEVAKVTYFLADPTNSAAETIFGRDLRRSVTHNLLPVIQEESDAQWLMGGVESILFYFYDGTQWRESWDSSTETNTLPLAIRVEIALASDPRNRIDRAPVQLVVPMTVQSRTNQTAEETESSE